MSHESTFFQFYAPKIIHLTDVLYEPKKNIHYFSDHKVSSDIT